MSDGEANASPNAETEPLLTLEGVETAYGTSQVLFGVDLQIRAGEIVTLMGRNGMGKTTTVRSIMGLTPPQTGRIAFRGELISGRPAHRIAQAGVGLVPEGRQVFPTLTVRENLEATAAPDHDGGRPWTPERVMEELFPKLAERATQYARTLSGGEQQMLAIGRALATNPSLLILDEATEGLAPRIREDIWRTIEHKLKPAGQAILMIDKHPKAMARIADRHYVMSKGRMVWEGSSDDLLSDDAMTRQHLGVS